MAYLALYRKWRPMIFADVLAQESVVETLQRSVANNTVAHAYLFCGTRGTGKTSAAKIFSRAVNCLNPVNGDPCNKCEVCLEILADSLQDVLEIDAASNNGVDHIREIRNDVSYLPSKAKYKVYIIDEVHMLSNSAFNALLKTLEEPPAHVIFILATTEPNKLPATVLSRCQRYDFKRIGADSIAKHLKTICDSLNVKAEPDALELISRLADGAMRDAINILDRCVSSESGHLTYNEVVKAVGIVEDDFFVEVTRLLIAGDIPALITEIHKLFMDGKDLTLFTGELINHFRNLVLCKSGVDLSSITDYSKRYIKTLEEQAKTMDGEYILCVIRELTLAQMRLSRTANSRVLLESTIIKICNKWFTYDNDEIFARLSLLESGVRTEQVTVKPDAPKAVEVKKPEPKPESEPEPKIEPEPELKIKPEPEPEIEPESEPEPEPIKEISKPKPVSGSSTLPKFEQWDKVRADLSSYGQKLLNTFTAPAKAFQVDENNLLIIFPDNKSFEKKYFDKADNIHYLSESIKRICGKEMHCKFIMEEDAGSILNNNPDNSTEASLTEDVSEKKDVFEDLKENDIPFEIIDD